MNLKHFNRLEVIFLGYTVCMIELKNGDFVAWKWGSSIAEGVVESIHSEPTSIVSKGKIIKRNGTAENPAVIIKHKSGNKVIKLMSELQKTI